MSVKSKGPSLVYMAMSGGIDSSVAAHILHSTLSFPNEPTYDVKGVYMHNWDSFDESLSCSSDQDFMDACSVARRIGLSPHSPQLPITRLSFVREYWTLVFQQMLTEYSLGRTPNPDILCNSQIKFKEFFQFARQAANGSAFHIATGHYAGTKNINGKLYLCKAKDLSKDQTYFLSNISYDALRHTLFPLADTFKCDVREKARHLQLPNAEKAESMGICFIGKKKYFADFLAKHLSADLPILLPGNFIDLDSGRIIGMHKGVAFYTIGQGARIHSQLTRWIVAKKNVEKRELIVVNRTDHPALKARYIIVTDMHWITDRPSEINEQKTDESEGKQGCVFMISKCSSDKMGKPAIITPFSRSSSLSSSSLSLFSFLTQHELQNINERSAYIIEYINENGEWNVAVGQYAVVYKGDLCLGGGPIFKVISEHDIDQFTRK